MDFLLVKEKMKNNSLFLVTDSSFIDDLKDKGISLFLYPLKDFSIGFDKTFSFDEIKDDNAFIYINMALNTSKAEKLDKLLKNIPSNIKGIVFEDIGIINMIKDKPIEKILYHPHINTNYKTINYYLEYVDNVIISTDLSSKEIEIIKNNTNKKISILSFGLIPSFYSRRLLLKSHSIHYNINYVSKKELSVVDNKFISLETEDGTYMYHYPYYFNKVNHDNYKYVLYMPLFLNKEDTFKVLDESFNNTDSGFLDKEIIYKIKDN